METINYEKQTLWEKRLDEWKSRAIEQQHFHENVSTYLKKVYDKSKVKNNSCAVIKD